MAIIGFGFTFDAGTGPIAYIKVKASADMSDASTTTLSVFRATTYTNATVALTTSNCTVTLEAEQGESDLTNHFRPPFVALALGLFFGYFRATCSALGFVSPRRV